ncbi:hypothetical protein, partial [Kitasatospora sp. NPDC057198]|uniref:hypothetical protein n=1 Tax=Kitasatospora sp. NPDC057198 TaxID=3346046 RepID=UPI00362F9A9A
PTVAGRAWAPGGWGGPGYHLLVLQETRDFWDGRGSEVVEPAEREIEDALRALAALLTARWGAPETLDLWPPDRVGLAGTAAARPEPLGFLSMLSGSVLLWRLPGSARWVGLSVGQADPEFPVLLLLAVGEVAVLARPGWEPG